MSLLDTSTKEVSIFWLSLDLAKETVQECIVLCDETFVLLIEDFII